MTRSIVGLESSELSRSTTSFSRSLGTAQLSYRVNWNEAFVHWHLLEEFFQSTTPSFLEKEAQQPKPAVQAPVQVKTQPQAPQVTQRPVQALQEQFPSSYRSNTSCLTRRFLLITILVTAQKWKLSNPKSNLISFNKPSSPSLLLLLKVLRNNPLGSTPCQAVSSLRSKFSSHLK